jgi:hypothetical protein
MSTTFTSQTIDLLSHLWSGGAWVYWWTPNGHEGRKESLWFPLDRRWPAVPAAWRERNLYFPVHPATRAGARWQRATNATVAALNTFYAEFDGKEGIRSHLDLLPLYPSYVVDSGGGLHCYWLIEDGFTVTDSNRAYLRHVQAAWVNLVGGDYGAKDSARILRLPGYQNRKSCYGPDYPTVEIVEHHPYCLFTFPQIEKLVEERVAQVEAQAQLRRE